MKKIFTNRLSTEEMFKLSNSELDDYQEFINSIKNHNSDILHVSFNKEDHTFYIDYDDYYSFWFTTSDYLIWFLRILESDINIKDLSLNKDVSHHTKKVQVNLILNELEKRGLKL